MPRISMENFGGIRNVTFSELEQSPLNPESESFLMKNDNDKYNFDLSIIVLIGVFLLFKNVYLLIGTIIGIFILKQKGLL